MDTSGSICGKLSFSELQSTGHRRLLEEDELPVKKKLKTRLVDLFNRVSICMASGAEDHMKVYLRIKPLCKNEDGNQQCFEVVETENTIVATAPEISHSYKSMKRGVGKSSHKFTFSRIFNEATTQGAFFNETMLDMTKDFISGQNSLVFTYGVTSSGKTYTIQGKPQDAGILPRCLDVIFNSINGKQIPSLTLKPQMFTDVVRLSAEEVLVEKRIKEKTMRMSVDDDPTVMTLLGDEMESVLSDNGTASTSGCAEDLLNEVKDRAREELKVDVEDQGKIRFGVWVSFAEIYNEQIFDLLEPMPIKKNARRPVLKICDDRNGNPYVKGLKEIHVETADEAYKLLTIGQRNLQTACTRLNHCSSRSHCIFNIKIVRVADKDDPHIARVSMLSLCDLAGSERYSKTQATGDRLKEAGNINSSLMTLGRCIETLRHNQLHKDQQKLVPFRDSKLTRLLQNFFNGSGRAAMIVNVSQCATMFDDTLHVFKFSAIAKQVKYIEKPPEKPKKTLPPRESIQWETQEAALRAAQNDPLPEDDDEEDELNDEEEESSENFKNMKEIRGYIKNLERRNEKLVEMLEEEMNAASSNENRVKKEVTQAMMKQVMNIEETYSALLKETREEGQELADERVKGIMEVYEQRLQRIQKKVDEDDEWVSSLLYHQEQVKVQERDLQITELKNLVAQLKSQVESKKLSADDSVDIGNSAVIETLTQKLQSVSNLSKEKDAKIDELESLLTEAGEVYNKHMVDIKELKETICQQNKKLENQLTSVAELNKKLVDITEQKDSEMKALEEDTTKKLKNEIERLQDQMSQLDEQSRYRNEFETSSVPEKLNNSSKSVDKIVTSITKGLDATYVETDSKNTSLEVSPAFNHSIGKESLDLAKGEDSMIISLQIQNEQMQADISELKVKLNQSLVEIAEANEMIKNLQNDNEEINEKYKISEMSVKSLQEENKALSEKVNSLHQANEELLVKVKQPTNSFSVSITEMVRKIENNLSASEHHTEAEEKSEDLNIKDQLSEMSVYKEQFSNMEQAYKETKEKLQVLEELKVKLETELAGLKVTLSTKEDNLKNVYEEYNKKLESLQAEFTSEEDVKTETIAVLKKQLEDVKQELDLKKKEYEKLECQRQEDGAEVSQKLLVLEREKKAAERRAIEAKEREEEWQMKCQGLEKIKQLEQKLHEQLRTTVNTLRKQSEQMNEQKEELSAKQEELNQLNEKLDFLKSCKVSMQKRVDDLQQEINAEKEEKKRLEKDFLEQTAQLDLIKSSFKEAEEMMDQQEKIINRQDDDLLHMKNEMRMVVKQKEELDAIVSSNNLEICNLNNQISKLKEEVSRLQILENRAKEVEQREKITENQMQKTSCEKKSLEDKLEKLEKEKLSYEETIENYLKMSKALKKDLGECEEKLHDAEKQKRTLEKNLLKMTEEQKSLKETIDLVHKEKSLLQEQIHHFETQVKDLTDSKIENENFHKNNQNKISEQLELHNKQLQQEIESLKLDIQSKQKQFDALQESLNETVENKKTVEKELQKQESINKRNREEMENWKKEKDTCVRQLENLISKRHEENSFLAHEIEQLKKDNSDLAKNMNTAISMKDSLIADLKKANNTLSIQLAHSQGTCPPPKMTSPDNSYFKNNELIEDLDTTGHLEIDATPPTAAKKGRKKQLLSEVFLTPVFKSLKTIEEQNESSPSKSSSSRSSQHSSSEQTAEASSITPITRSAKRQKENKKKKMQEPFNLASYVAADESQNENVNPYSTRRSSRLKTKK
ncbi:kinesin-like protein KIF20B isoform X2 [Physella acuta]|uniref:kinesin-like protein KIF20B isoform X2 n=1 Tax=Physella acuta TaxID=109671 RepID=UPI0027DDB6AC|nr:kinesin-like protein KIF20B isoform X2 [Physella acuta]